MTTFLFEFVYGLKQAIYTQLVVICGKQNYTLNTKHAISGVIEEGTSEAEVRGSIPSNCVVNEKFRDLRLRWSGFITPTASENRFPLAVLNYPPVKMVISTDP